jgi:hypothetical protein
VEETRQLKPGNMINSKPHSFIILEHGRRMELTIWAQSEIQARTLLRSHYPHVDILED